MIFQVQRFSCDNLVHNKNYTTFKKSTISEDQNKSTQKYAIIVLFKVSELLYIIYN